MLVVTARTLSPVQLPDNQIDGITAGAVVISIGFGSSTARFLSRPAITIYTGAFCSGTLVAGDVTSIVASSLSPGVI